MDILSRVNSVGCTWYVVYLTSAEQGIVSIVSAEDDKAGGSKHIYRYLINHAESRALLTEWKLCNHLGRSGPFLRGE